MFTLRNKVFLTLATLSLILTACFYIYTVNSFRHNFNQYIIEKETRFAADLISDLEEKYNRHKNWSWIDNWQTYLDSIFKDFPALKDSPAALFPQPDHPVKFTGAMPPPHILNKITLIDKYRHTVHGNLSTLNSITLSLTNEGELIGFLIIPKNPSLQDLKDAEFLELQLKKLGISMILTLFIAFIVSIPLAHLSIYLLADKRRILQLLTGLLKNSLDYTNSPGVTYIIINKLDNKVKINIEDSAPGVTDEQLPKLFDRLYRGDASRSRASGGAGLGLSICKNIVEAHQGEIQVTHSDFGGLKVTIILPCYNQS